MIVNKSLIMHLRKRSPAAEAYRMLRTNLLYAKNGTLPQVVVITSTTAGEGKTTTSCNLAFAFAQTGRKVLLIDGDIRKPAIHQLFGLSKLVGLASVLKNPETLSEAIYHIEECNLDIITSGPSLSDPTELMSSATLIEVFNTLKKMYDIIIIDTPPVGIVTDAAMFAPVSDGYVLVVAEGSASVSEFKNAKEHLLRVGADIFGVVFNKMGIVLGRDSYYYKYYYNKYYYYGYGREPDQKTSGKRGKKKKRGEVVNAPKVSESAETIDTFVSEKPVSSEINDIMETTKAAPPTDNE